MKSVSIAEVELPDDDTDARSAVLAPPSEFHRAKLQKAAKTDPMLQATRPRPAWMDDPSLLPKKPPTRGGQ